MQAEFFKTLPGFLFQVLTIDGIYVRIKLYEDERGLLMLTRRIEVKDDRTKERTSAIRRHR